MDLEDRDPRKQRRGKKKRGWLARLVRFLFLTALVGALLGAGAAAAVFVYYGSDPRLPTLNKISDYRPLQTTRILSREGSLIGEMGSERRTVVPWGQIPKVMVQAAMAAEDADFYRHEGISYRAIARSIFEDLTRGHYAQGGSTITQQVVKQVLLTPERTLRRKVQEMILARRISQQLSKDEILEIYLNNNYFGHGVYGCEEAARFYFGKPVAGIDVSEAALLAGLIQAPERLSPRKHMDAARARRRYVLLQMARHGFISTSEADKLAAEPIALSPDSRPGSVRAPEATDAVARVLRGRYGVQALSTLGTTVKTTIDARLQELARRAVEQGLEELDARQGYRGPSGHLAGKELAKARAQLAASRTGDLTGPEIVEGIVERVESDPAQPKRAKIFVDVGGQVGVVDSALEPRYDRGPVPVGKRFRAGDLVRVRAAPERRKDEGEFPLALELGPQAAMVVMDPQAREVLAQVGGYGFRAGGFNRAERAQRQPGSAFKPFVYAAAIDSGRYTAASVVNDAPEVYDLWKPSNYEKEEFRGPVRLRTALAHSINTVAIKLIADIGLPAVRDVAARAGITSPLPDSLGLSMALGSGSVTPLELANAYATFAAGGLWAETSLVTQVGSDDQAAIPTAALQTALRPETAYVMVSLLRGVVAEGTARAAASRIARPLAGKTGTSNGGKDAWFVGFTPDLLAAVWVGFDDGRKMGKGEAGSKTALPIFIEFMVKALEGRPVRDFAQPAGVIVARVDSASGLAVAPDADGIEEVFIDGTVPPEATGQAASADRMLLERDPAPARPNERVGGGGLRPLEPERGR